jgi:HK97 family phage major capsid protein
VDEKTVVIKLGEIGDRIKSLQETNDRLEKNYDGLDLQNVKENAEKAAKGLESVQELKQQIAAMDHKERLDEIELAIARNGSGGENAKKEQEKAYHSNMLKYMRRGTPIEPELHEKMCRAQIELEHLGVGEKSRVDSQAKDLVAASGPDGGYFVLPERSTSISTRIYETSPLRPVANIATTSSDVWEITLDDDEHDAGWVGETDARPTTATAQVGLIRIPVHEMYAQPRVTQKMLDDAGFDIEGWNNNKVASKFSRLENTSFVSGDGSKKAKGFLSYAAWAAAGVYERNKVEQVTATGTAGTLDEADDLITLQNTLLEDFQAGAAWGMRRATFTSVMQLKDSQGQYLLDPRILKTGTDKVLLGSPVIFMSDMPAVAANALAVVYADWSEFYTIVDRMGVRLLRDPYTAKPYVRFYTTKRVGGAVTNFQAGKILKINA